MADTLTTTTQVDPAVATYYDRVLLMAATANLVHLKFAQHAMLAKKSGNTYKWRRYANLTAATTPLTEGVDPPGQQLSKVDLTAQISWFGDYVHITDVVDLTVEDQVLTVAADKLGEQMDRTFDILMRDVLAACASATNASGGDNGQTPTEITRADIDAVVMTLMGNDARFVNQIVTAGTGQGTTPVRQAFWSIIHTDIIDNLEACTGYKHASEYPSQKDVQPEEWGATGNVRWLWSSIAHSDSSTPTQYFLPIIGRDAYGDVELAGTAKNMVKGFGSGGTSDPLERKATSAWKAAWAGRILNDSFMHILKVTEDT